MIDGVNLRQPLLEGVQLVLEHGRVFFNFFVLPTARVGDRLEVRQELG